VLLEYSARGLIKAYTKGLTQQFAERGARQRRSPRPGPDPSELHQPGNEARELEKFGAKTPMKCAGSAICFHSATIGTEAEADHRMVVGELHEQDND
jgi:hypothetical protein